MRLPEPAVVAGHQLAEGLMITALGLLDDPTLSC